jgi:hypothetical protein
MDRVGDHMMLKLMVCGEDLERAIGVGCPLASTTLYLSSVNSGFHSEGHCRARFDLGRELATDERITLTFSYQLTKLPFAHPFAPRFGVTVPFDRMDLVELAFRPIRPEMSIVSTNRNYLVGSIVHRQWKSIVLEDRLANGSYTGVFTAPCVYPATGVVYTIELNELEKTSFRQILDEVVKE